MIVYEYWQETPAELMHRFALSDYWSRRLIAALDNDDFALTLAVKELFAFYSIYERYFKPPLGIDIPEWFFTSEEFDIEKTAGSPCGGASKRA